jgi:hypothetical protein
LNQQPEGPEITTQTDIGIPVGSMLFFDTVHWRSRRIVFVAQSHSRETWGIFNLRRISV